MTTVIDSVMTETIASVECDVCDGIFKKSDEKDKRLKSKVKCNTVNESQKEKMEISRVVKLTGVRFKSSVGLKKGN